MFDGRPGSSIGGVSIHVWCLRLGAPTNSAAERLRFPGLAIMLTVLSLNLFGDGLRDALDVRTVSEAE